VDREQGVEEVEMANATLLVFVGQADVLRLSRSARPSGSRG
jgi:hypothetical protein